MTTGTAAPDLAAIKERQQKTWASGDYGTIATTLVLIAEQLCETVDLHAGERVLDVAAGSGNAALAAARRSCDVWATDYVPQLLERARERAAAERLTITFREADAEALPFPDGSFDAILSTLGVMFAPNQERVAGELLRVCRPGGKIGLANWTPEGFVGEMFRVIGRHVPPPAGVKPPPLWGTEPRLRELFGDAVSSLQVVRRHHPFRYRSPQHWLEAFRTFYGPMLKAFEGLDPSGQERLASDLLELAQRFNQSGDETLVAPGEYLDVVAIKNRAAGPDRDHPEDWR
ncbi:MAG: class I SAM-dependent methyltransferase [Chloroflexi bacterium]|nr:class I SAM-dependent methyltransferase [Chloroflexota bacterium]